jgi:hypothetical protein
LNIPKSFSNYEQLFENHVDFSTAGTFKKYKKVERIKEQRDRAFIKSKEGKISHIMK